MSGRTRAVVLLGTLGALILGAGATGLRAGPATYDKATRGFRFRYTFADLPSGQIGSVVGATARRPSSEQEENVRRFVEQVGELLSAVTEGRARIGQLDYVDDIKDADLVISLSGQPRSAGWAIRGAIDGRPGQIALYYNTLVPEVRQDVVFTVVHEILHYVFGLADEYDPAQFPGGCPRASGPVCLMDNYLSGGRGFMGRLCARGGGINHNSQPGQPDSCQEIVDRFFTQRGVSKEPLLATDPTEASKKAVITSAVAQVRAEAKRDPRKAASSALRRFAGDVLRDLIARFNQGTSDKLIFTREQLAEATRLIADVGSLVTARRPPGLESAIFDRLRAEAKRLGESEAVRKRTSETLRASAIRTGLRSFLAALREQAPVGLGPEDLPPAEERAMLEALAREAAQDPDDRVLGELVARSTVELELNRLIADYVLTALDELNAPGTKARLGQLAELDARLRRFRIPGRTSAGFGLRRSRFITPDPFYDPRSPEPPELRMLVVTQGGVFPYRDVRDRGFAAFAGLISRARIELDQPEFRAQFAGSLALDQPLDPATMSPFDTRGAELLRAAQTRRNRTLQGYLNGLLDELDRNRLENIAVLVPPGGLPPGLGQALEVLRAKLGPEGDVRLDLVLVGPQEIDPRLRNLAYRSRGSVLTVADIDEVATIAQRLRDEQTSGSWVIIPQPGTIPAGVRPVTADQLGQRLAWARQLGKAVAGVLKEADTRLQAVATEQGAARTELSRQQIDRARQVSRTLLNAVGRLQDLKWPDPPADPDGVRAFRQQVSGLNGALIAQIAEGRAALATARQLVRLATRDEVGADEQTRPVFDLARGLVAEDRLGPDLARVDTLLRSYEKVLEASLQAAGERVPIYQRTDRAAAGRTRERLDNGAIGRLGNPIDAIAAGDAADAGGPTRLLRLPRFHAEAHADFELALGLSRPLPRPSGVPDYREPTIELYDDSGVRVDSEAKLALSVDASTDTLLVWRASAPHRLSEGWYNPFLRIDRRTLEELDGTRAARAEPGLPPEGARSEIHYTFSVGSSRENVQLIATVVEAPDDSDRGTLHPGEREAVVEVQVSAGSSVLGARVEGFYQRITAGAAPIETRRFTLADDGQVVRPALGDQPELRDRAKGDGVYTGSILISDVTAPTEFRVFLQCETLPTSSFVALDDPNRGVSPQNSEAAGTPPAGTGAAAEPPAAATTAVPDDATFNAARAKRDQAAAEGAVPKFQRATSVHFHVAGVP
jgi:hypothetical protein